MDMRERASMLMVLAEDAEKLFDDYIRAAGQVKFSKLSDQKVQRAAANILRICNQAAAIAYQLAMDVEARKHGLTVEFSEECPDELWVYSL